MASICYVVKLNTSLHFQLGSTFASSRYEQMLEEAELFREWYLPHNKRLEELLGRKMMW